MRLGRLNPRTPLDTTVSDAPKTWNRQQRAPACDEVLLDYVEEQRSHAIERETGGKLPCDENCDENHDKRQEKLHDLRYLHGSISNFSNGVGLRRGGVTLRSTPPSSERMLIYKVSMGEARCRAVFPGVFSPVLTLLSKSSPQDAQHD